MIARRDEAIDILKFFAAILITNSHLEVFEPAYKYATGGTFGDVLFIFCSGFTLFLGRMGRFDDWYKKRLMRIFPPIICWGIIAAFCFKSQSTLKDVIINGGGWFVQCILIYYVLGYIINKYAIDYLKFIFLACFLITIIWFALIDKESDFTIYGWNYCKWSLFFLLFLLGAKMGLENHSYKREYSWSFLTTILFCSVVLWYMILWIQSSLMVDVYLQLLTILPLISFTWAAYRICKMKCIAKFFAKPIIYKLYRSIGGLCYEIYLVQYIIFKRVECPVEYPINIPVILCVVWIFAYILHVFTAFCLQTVHEGGYNWRQIISIY